MPATRFADFTWDAGRKRLICVGETHGAPHEALPENALWTVPAGGEAGPAPVRLLAGRDFYASPRLSGDGRRLAFLAWDLPHMPWDAAQLFVASVAEDGSLSEPLPIAGGNGSACFQPEWGADGTLYFVWDADGTGKPLRLAGRVRALESHTILHPPLPSPLSRPPPPPPSSISMQSFRCRFGA